MFTHLHTHSYFSFLDGLLSPETLVELASRQGMKALALTDHDGMTGAIKFYDACNKAGIKPIVGLEITTRHPFGKGNLILLCTSMTGWANLCRLSTMAQGGISHSSKQGILVKDIETYSSDLICLCGGKRSLPNELIGFDQVSTSQKYIAELSEIFGKKLYIELQLQDDKDIPVIKELKSICEKLNLEFVATNNVHFQAPSQAQLHQILCAIRLNTVIHQLPPGITVHKQSYFTSHNEMSQRFRELPEAINNTWRIAEQSNLELPLGKRHYPEIDLSPGSTATNIMRNLAKNGAEQKYGEISSAIQERLDYELDTIDKRGYASLFLIVSDILEYAKKSGVPTASRGSAASSLVAHCLGITTPDPMALDLYFERFLNPARTSPPDIDIDLCSKRRHKVIKFVYDKYGGDRVAMVATINRYQSRSALREVSKAHGLNSIEINNLLNKIPHRGWSSSRFHGKSQGDPFVVFFQDNFEPKYKTIFKNAADIIGFPRHLSVHPGGVVITPSSLTDLVPTHLAAKGIQTTQFDLESIERLGLVKIDLLGTRGLTVLGDVAEKVQKWCLTEFPNSLCVLESISQSDPDTKALLKSGETIGCFAIESPGMRHTLREIHAGSIDDIMIALALYRPGPMTGGLKDAFIKRHLGLEPEGHIHPALAHLLTSTHGVILYQEQVLKIASELAGLSLTDADLLRRAMSHFDPGERMKTLRKRFIEGAKNQSGVPEHIGSVIWDMMAAFAGYGFPKAHAASYAEVAWKSIWCKAHYPAEFIAAVLAAGGGYYRQYVYINEARRMGLNIHPPHINHSNRLFSCRYPDGTPTLYMGLKQVRELSSETLEKIINHRPFNSIDEFLARVNPKRNEVTNLIKVGAFIGFGTIPDLLSLVKTYKWQPSQPPLFHLNERVNGEQWDLLKRFNAQKSILGIGIETHPVSLLNDKNLENIMQPIRFAKNNINSIACLVGIKQTLQRFHRTEVGGYYQLELDDPTGVMPVRLTYRQYKEYKNIFSSSTPFVVEGRVLLDPSLEMVYLDAQKISSLDSIISK